METNRPARPELEALIKAAKEKLDAISPEEREKLLKAQRESWVRAEKNWPKAKFSFVNGVKVYESYEDYIND
jgi:hypothetical protein